MVQDADRGFDGAFFVGYHGGAGDADAVLCHTYTPSVIYEVRINGVRCSEATINAGLARLPRRSALLVSGDRTTVEGVQAQMPWVRGAVVKESIGNFAANSMTPAAAQRAIRRAAEEAVRDAPEAKPYRFEPPLTLDVQLVTAAQAHLVATIPGFERTGSRSVRFTHDELSGRLQSLRRHLAPRAPWRERPFQELDHIQLAMPATWKTSDACFYRDLLGMSEVQKPPELVERGGVWFRSDTVFVHIGVDSTFVQRSRPIRRSFATISPVLSCAFVRRTWNLNGEPLEDGRRHCYVADPFGNRIELIE